MAVFIVSRFSQVPIKHFWRSLYDLGQDRVVPPIFPRLKFVPQNSTTNRERLHVVWFMTSREIAFASFAVLCAFALRILHAKLAKDRRARKERLERIGQIMIKLTPTLLASGSLPYALERRFKQCMHSCFAFDGYRR